jgi:hypothetical protein
MGVNDPFFRADLLPVERAGDSYQRHDERHHRRDDQDTFDAKWQIEPSLSYPIDTSHSRTRLPAHVR